MWKWYFLISFILCLGTYDAIIQYRRLQQLQAEVAKLSQDIAMEEIKKSKLIRASNKLYAAISSTIIVGNFIKVAQEASVLIQRLQLEEHTQQLILAFTLRASWENYMNLLQQLFKQGFIMDFMEYELISKDEELIITMKISIWKFKKGIRKALPPFALHNPFCHLAAAWLIVQ